MGQSLSSKHQREVKTRTPGIYLRGDKRIIRKKVKGTSIRASLGRVSQDYAERYLAQEIDRINRASHFGERPVLTVNDLADYYIEWGKLPGSGVSVQNYKNYVKYLKPIKEYFGEYETAVAPSYVESYINYCRTTRKKKLRSRSINHHLGAMQRIFTLAATKWFFEDTRLSFLAAAPVVPKASTLSYDDALRVLGFPDKKESFVIPKAGEANFLALLPEHLRPMAHFILHTGLRQKGIRTLRWEWEQVLEDDESGESVFVIPAGETKNRKAFILVLNAVARRIIENQRDNGSAVVFPYGGEQLGEMNTRAWQKAWKGAGFPVGEEYSKGPHQLRKTFASRLRALDANKQDISDLLHHSARDVTDLYTLPTVTRLREVVEILIEKPRLKMVG